MSKMLFCCGRCALDNIQFVIIEKENRDSNQLLHCNELISNLTMFNQIKN